METITKSELAEFLCEGIKASGLSYEEIAKRCGYKSELSLRAMATGKIPVPIDQASKITEALGCDPDRFIALVLQSFLPIDVIVAMGRAIERYPPT